MGGIHQTAKHVKAGIDKIGANLEAALEPVWGMVREAARSKDLSVPTVTLYVQEDIGVGKFLQKELEPADRLSGQITGVYVPPSVKAGATVNVILYMHGDKVRVWNAQGTIRDYLNLPKMPLRQGLSTSGKPFILIAPTLGKKAAVEFGNLGSKIDDHLDHVLAQLQLLGPPEYSTTQPPVIGDLIIAGHSGAYKSMTEILKTTKYKSKIIEVWGFDIMYDAAIGSELAKMTVPVYLYFNDTAKLARGLAGKKKNIFVMEPIPMYTKKGPGDYVIHDLLMQRFWLDRCQRIGTNGMNPEDKKRMI